MAPESSTFIAVNAPRYKTAVMHGEFLALAPNVSANQFLITAESIVAALFLNKKKALMEKWKANIRSDALSLIEFGQWLSA